MNTPEASVKQQSRRQRLRRGTSDLKSLPVGTESVRERDALRHLHAWIDIHQPAAIHYNPFATGSSGKRDSEPCNDAALAAFAQLCALRLNARRVLVTLLSTSVEYVLSEASRTTSLQYDTFEDPKDFLWIGTCSFPKDYGFNGPNLNTWRKARRFRDIPPDVDQHYYTEGQSPHCADNIAEHLEASIVRSQRQRSERLIQALGIFNNGRGTLRDWWLARDDERIERGGRHEKSNADAKDQRDRADAEFGVQDAYMSDSTVSSRRMMHRQTSGDPTSDGEVNSIRGSRQSSINCDDVHGVSDADQKAGSDNATSTQPSAQKRPPMFSADTTAKLERSSGTTRENAMTQSQGAEQGVSTMDFDPRPKESDATSAPKFIGESRPNPPRTVSAARLAQKQSSAAAEQKSASENTAPSQDVYARASNLMREALGAEGAVCVNGTAVSARIKSDRNLAGDSTSGAAKAKSDSSGEDAATTTSDTDSDASSRAARLCKVQGFSTRNRSSLTGTRPERQRFGLTEQELHKLVKTFPRGKIFNFEESGNLYSSSGDESTSGSNEEGTRTNKSSSDRVNLSAEIKRVETVASDTAKATFISSVSHELRSPLHGVMAGIEMILDSELTPFQKEMALNAAVAGRTLLDTNLRKTQRKEQADADSERNRRPGSQQSNGPQERLSVDLARLTEEVVETVVSGHRYHELSRRGSLPRDVEKRQTVEPTDDSKSLCVTLDIDKCDSWNIDMAPGVWTRIITNVLGSFSNTERAEAAAEQDRHNGVVTLEVRDTGIGISQDFLAKHIYTPFKQADSHSAGTGLGLSIVKRIARDLRADLNVESELGEGTAVSLTFATVFDHTAKASEDLDELSKAAAPNPDCGFHLINLPAKMEHQHSALANAVGKNASRIASAWLGFALSSGLSLPPEAKDCTPLANLREEGREAESGTDYFPAQSDRQDQQATPQRSKSSPTVPIRQTSDKPGNTNGSEQQTSPASPAVMTPSLLQALMRKLHVPFQCASNGLEAFTIYSAHPRDFFLVLMDVDMPVMDGKQATAKIRELERKQQLPRTCVVALTGVTSQSARQECMDCGMDKFYTKPIRMKGLSALVTETRPALPDGKGEEGG
ncbi:hypothetical protein L1887_55576 [Cichorium endivia]|nr:hypothetical protein L1887_55576 [Cichorium endivia]